MNYEQGLNKKEIGSYNSSQVVIDRVEGILSWLVKLSIIILLDNDKLFKWLYDVKSSKNSELSATSY